MKTPAISVVMPLHNAGAFLRNSTESILTQTFTDFEFIIINDRSTDNSAEILSSIKDPRIVRLENPYNTGHYIARNRGHAIARGKYICAMDSDDLAHPQRLEEQFVFMEKNPEIGISGSNCRLMPKDIISQLPLSYDKLKIGFITAPRVFFHPTLIMRRSLLDKFGLKYNEEYIFAGDGDFFMQGSKYFPIANIASPLLTYFSHKNNITTRHSRTQIFLAKIIVGRYISSVLKIPVTGEEMQIHFNLMWGGIVDKEYIHMAYRWIDKIILANKNQRFFNDSLLEEELRHLTSTRFSL